MKITRRGFFKSAAIGISTIIISPTKIEQILPATIINKGKSITFGPLKMDCPIIEYVAILRNGTPVKIHSIIPLKSANKGDTVTVHFEENLYTQDEEILEVQLVGTNIPSKEI